MSAPVLTIIAGSNGCGKSTLSSYAKEEFQSAPILDPDAFAKSIRDTLPSSQHDIEAGKRVLLRAHELIEAHQSFTVETTLSGSTYLRMALRAQNAGFLVALIFVGTTSVEINLERVRARVAKGGHDVPEEDQRRRYPRTLANLRKLLPLADFVVLLDNSTPTGYTLVGLGHRAFMHWNEPLPNWAEGLKSQ